jgi:hypothetical protein
MNTDLEWSGSITRLISGHYLERPIKANGCYKYANPPPSSVTSVSSPCTKRAYWRLSAKSILRDFCSGYRDHLRNNGSIFETPILVW